MIVTKNVTTILAGRHDFCGKAWRTDGNPTDRYEIENKKDVMLKLTAKVRSGHGQNEEKKFELRNPELDQWLKDTGDGLNGFDFVDE